MLSIGVSTRLVDGILWFTFGTLRLVILLFVRAGVYFILVLFVVFLRYLLRLGLILFASEPGT